MDTGSLKASAVALNSASTSAGLDTSALIATASEPIALISFTTLKRGRGGQGWVGGRGGGLSPVAMA
jgi:hypothetical protein